MSTLQDVTSPEYQAEQLGKALDEVYDKMSAFVCEHGPELLTRGMPPLEANTAIMACLERLKNQRDLAFRIVDCLPDYSVGCSFMSEEEPEKLIKELSDARHS